jgi:DNA-binding MarR family transcriptional regulator
MGWPQNTKNPFFREKPARAIVCLSDETREWYASSLAKKVDCTFPHMAKTLSAFSELGLVSFREKGRKKIVFLTPGGRKAASLIAKCFELMARTSKPK